MATRKSNKLTFRNHEGNTNKKNLIVRNHEWSQLMDDITNMLAGTLAFTQLTTDTISENTAGSGVTIDGVLLKDGTITTTGPNIESVDAAITATGTDDTDGYALTESLNIITGGAANTGVELPTAVVGTVITVVNLTASVKNVYANTSDGIDDQTATTGSVILQPEQVVTFRCHTTALWQSDFESQGAYDQVYTDGLTENSTGTGITVNSNFILTEPTHNDISATITAFAGGGQGSATAITNTLNTITVVATDGDSVALPSAVAGLKVTISNADAAQYADIFPASGDGIETVPVNSAIRIYPNERITFYAEDATTWRIISIVDTNTNAGTVNAAGGTIVGVETGDKHKKVTTLTLTAAPLGAVAGAADEVINVLLYTFPAGEIAVHGAFASLSLQATTQTADTPDVGLGTDNADGDAVATLNLADSSSGDAENVLTGMAMVDANGTTAVSSELSALSIPTANDHTVYLNVADGWAGPDAAVTATGTVRIEWSYLGA